MRASGEISEDELAGVVVTLGLGEFAAPPEALKGGMAPTWRVRTVRGEFHVKVWLERQWAWRDQNLAGAAEVEAAASGNGVEMAEMVAVNVRTAVGLVTVHRWLEGARPLGPDDNVAEWVGGTLARLHRIPAPASSPADALKVFYGMHPGEEWSAWIAEGREQGLRWADAARASLPVIAGASALVGSAVAGAERVVGSHRDLHGLNVLRTAEGYRLVDWDLAGPEVPWFETVRAAVEFGRLAGTTAAGKPLAPDASVARAVIEAYVRAGGERGNGGAEAFAGTVGMALGRIAYAMFQSLGQREATEAERATQTAYIATAVAKLEARLAGLEEMRRAVLGVRG